MEQRTFNCYLLLWASNIEIPGLCLAERRESAVGKGRAIMICSICDNLSLFSARSNTVTLKESVTSKHDEFRTLYPLAGWRSDAVNRMYSCKSVFPIGYRKRRFGFFYP